MSGLHETHLHQGSLRGHVARERRRRDHAGGRGADPGRRRGPAARRRRLRGRPRLRRRAATPGRSTSPGSAGPAPGCAWSRTSTPLRAEAEALLAAAGEPESLLRLVVTRGGRRIAIVEPLPVRGDDRAGRDDHLRADARAQRAQDALLRGRTCSRSASPRSRATTRRCSSPRTGACSRARRGRSSGSPAGGCARRRCPRGSSTRSRARKLLEACEVEERICTLDDVRAAEEAFIASTVREVMPIVAVGEIELPAAPGPVTREAARRVARARRAGARGGRAFHVKRVLTVIGNRPQFIKAAAVSGPLRAVADEVLVHTGQHYDDALSQVFFDELELPRPEHQLDLGGGTNTEQTARMLAALGPLLARRATRRSCSSTATRTRRSPARSPRRRRGVPVAHVEAGHALATTARCPRSSTACSPTTRATCCCARPRRRRRSCAASASRARSRWSAT